MHTDTRIVRPPDDVLARHDQYARNGAPAMYTARHGTETVAAPHHIPGRHRVDDTATRVLRPAAPPSAVTRIAVPVPPRPATPLTDGLPVAPVTEGLLRRVLRGLRRTR